MTLAALPAVIEQLPTDHQDLHNQRHGILEYANVHALSPIQFIEDSVSGREKWESRGVGLLLTETAQAEDVVIFSEVSRMARSTLQVLEMLECCVRRSINVHIAKQGMVLEGASQLCSEHKYLEAQLGVIRLC